MFRKKANSFFVLLVNFWAMFYSSNAALHETDFKLLLYITANHTTLLSDILTGGVPREALANPNKPYFASTLLDQWNDNTNIPESVLLTLCGDRDKTIWGVRFYTNKTSSANFSEWFRSENYAGYIERSMPKTLLDPVVDFNILDTLAVISSPPDLDKAFFVYDTAEVLSSRRNMFYYTANANREPFRFKYSSVVHYDLVGCYKLGLGLDKMLLVNLTISKCAMECGVNASETSYIGLAEAKWCYCFKGAADTTVPLYGECGLLCFDTNEDCGGNGLRAAIYTVTLRDKKANFIISELRLGGDNFTNIGRNCVSQVKLVISLGEAIELGVVPIFNAVGAQFFDISLTHIKDVNYSINHRKGRCNDSNPNYTPYKEESQIKIFSAASSRYDLDPSPARCMQLEATVNTKCIHYCSADVFGHDGIGVLPTLSLFGEYKTEDFVNRAPLTAKMTATNMETAVMTTLSQTDATEVVPTANTSSEEVTTVTSTMTVVTPYTALVTDTASVNTSCCFCDCSMYQGFTKWNFEKKNEMKNESEKAEYINKVIVELKANNTINRTATSSYQRTKNSAPDKRPSSQSIGFIGFIFIIFSLAFIIFLDLSMVRINMDWIRQNLPLPH